MIRGYKFQGAEAKAIIKWLMDFYGFESYADLSRAIDVREQEICRYNRGAAAMGPICILKIHDYSKRSLDEIRRIAKGDKQQ